jgi:hypothetical protein
MTLNGDKLPNLQSLFDRNSLEMKINVIFESVVMFDTLLTFSDISKPFNLRDHVPVWENVEPHDEP